MSDSAYTVTQDTGKVAWYSHLFKNFPHFIVIHTIKSFSVVNGTEVDVFLEFFWFLYDPTNVAIRSLVPLSFLNPACTSGSSQFIYCWCLAWRILSITLLTCEVSAIPFSRGSSWTRDCPHCRQILYFHHQTHPQLRVSALAQSLHSSWSY